MKIIEKITEKIEKASLKRNVEYLERVGFNGFHFVDSAPKFLKKRNKIVEKVVALSEKYSNAISKDDILYKYYVAKVSLASIDRDYDGKGDYSMFVAGRLNSLEEFIFDHITRCEEY